MGAVPGVVSRGAQVTGGQGGVEVPASAASRKIKRMKNTGVKIIFKWKYEKNMLIICIVNY